MHKRYATLCGLTEAELHPLFDAEIHHLAEDNGLTDAEACQNCGTGMTVTIFVRVAKGVQSFLVAGSLDSTSVRQLLVCHWYAHLSGAAAQRQPAAI